MQKNIVKVITTFLVIVAIISVASTVFAVSPSLISATTSGKLQGSLKTVSGNILGAVQIIGTAVAVIMLIVLAIKYISAAPGDKAEIKKHAVVYVVGAVLLFAASNILGLIQQAASWFA